MRLALAACLAATSALAHEVAIHGSQQDGFGRIELRFDEPTKVQVRLSNGILVIGFGEAARVTSERLASELGSYVSAARRDPDQTGIRLAMVTPVRPSVLEAGERVFVDLLPPKWSGLPPGLPAEVVADLANRARIAEARLRRDERRPAERPKPVLLRMAELPTLTRLVFVPPEDGAATLTQAGPKVEIRFADASRLDENGNKPKLAAGIGAYVSSQSDGALTVRLAAAAGYEAHPFREDGTIVVDFARPAADKPAASEADAMPPAPATPPAPGAAHAKAAENDLSRDGLAKRAAGEGGQHAPAASADAGAPKAVPAPVPPAERDAKPSDASPRREAKPAGHLAPRLEMAAEGPSIVFPFAVRTPAAAFVEEGRVTLVFDTRDILDPEALDRLRSVVPVDRPEIEDGFVVLRLKPPDGRTPRLAADGTSWRLVLGSETILPPDPLKVSRQTDENGYGQIAIGLASAAAAHWLQEPGTGRRIAVVTAVGRPQSIAMPRTFVEFALPPTLHGVVVDAAADDLVVALGQSGVLVSRPGGLSISSSVAVREGEAGEAFRPVLAREAWLRDQAGSVIERYHTLIAAAAEAPRSGKAEARFRLAHFLCANGMDAEAGGVLALARSEDPVFARRRETLLLSGVASLRAGHLAEAKGFLTSEVLSDDPEAALWRAMLDVRERRWSPALVGFRRSAEIVANYADDVAATLRLGDFHAALEGGEIGRAEAELAAIDRMPTGTIANDEHDLARARLDEAAGRREAASKAYERLAEEGDRPVAAEARLRAVKLGSEAGTLPRDAAIRKLELLSVAWRGGETELGTIIELAHLYAGAGRWRDAFAMDRRANRYFPQYAETRTLHDQTSKMFENLLLGADSAKLPPVEALALYYDFRELAPVGRRGDEIVRRLADRLVELDLLGQAADLLEYQVDKRLTGAARATVAARLATIRLMDGKPLAALETLHRTRLADLPQGVNRFRLLLEARALSDLSRTALALEVLEGESGADADRLRASVLWSARRWREAGEAEEALVGTRWQGREPLSDRDRRDVLRAAVADTLAEEPIARDRLKQKFSSKMADSPDAGTFELLMQPGAIDTPAFRTVAQDVTKGDTLRELLADWTKGSADAAEIGAAPAAKPETAATAAPSQAAKEPVASPS